jgi:hypothetical protein
MFNEVNLTLRQSPKQPPVGRRAHLANLDTQTDIARMRYPCVASHRLHSSSS